MKQLNQQQIWKLIAAAGIAAMAYAWADEENFDEPELFALGAGAATAGVLLWRDPPDWN